MPAQYEAIRNRFIQEGMAEKEAKTRAAKIYNARHPGAPVGPGYHDRKRKKKPGT